MMKYRLMCKSATLRRIPVFPLLVFSALGLTGCVLRPTLEMFQIDTPPCYDRSVQPQTAVVDTHLHFRPFGGPAIPFEEMISYLEETGVLFANVYGIGQMLPPSGSCTYYLDCPGTPVTPTLKNDFVNAANYITNAPPSVHLTLSMTFPDLSQPESVLPGMQLLEEEYPGAFTWMGEVNLVKQAVFGNGREPVPMADTHGVGRFHGGAAGTGHPPCDSRGFGQRRRSDPIPAPYTRSAAFVS